MKQKKTFGLALSGGGPRGMAHIGALQALEDLGIKPGYIAGTSVGALVGALYVFGVPLQQQREFAESLSWWKISKFRWRSLGIATNEPIKEMVEEFLEQRHIEEAPIPFSILTADIVTGERVVLRSGDVALAVRATTALPGLYAPVKIDDRMLVDGGIVENIPVSPLLEDDCDVIIGIDLLANRPIRTEPKKTTDIIANTFYIIMTNYQHGNEHKADLILKPKLEKVIQLDKQSLDDM